MDVPGWVWTATLVGMTAILIADLLVVARRPHEPSLREAALWVTLYVGLAVVFGFGVWYFAGGEQAGRFAAGWLTEYSLSVDNLFIFVVIMSRFAVPRPYQQKILMIGIIMALVMRGLFIWAGTALINQFVWVFYIFGAFLLYTAAKLVTQGELDAGDYKENALIKYSRRILPISRNYDGSRLTTRSERGRRIFTPLAIVMIAIGTTDLIFALDSIPAIFGLTTEPYLVFTVNVFALMGLRQLYFLLGGLLNRLAYLSIGLAIVLGFIGVKLILEALHQNNVPFINAGAVVPWAPEISIQVSLAVIGGTLAVTTIASLIRTRRQRSRVGPPPAATSERGTSEAEAPDQARTAPMPAAGDD